MYNSSAQSTLLALLLVSCAALNIEVELVPAQRLTAQFLDPCSTWCSAEDAAAVSQATELASAAGSECGAEVSAVLCASWCSPLRARYTSGAASCGEEAVVPRNVSVAVCPRLCADMEAACGVAVCNGTGVLSGDPFRMEEAQAECAGERLIGEASGLERSSDGARRGLARFTYSVRLDAEPGTDIVVDIQSDQVVAAPPLLTFTPTAWDAFQVVTLTGLDDDMVQPEVVVSRSRRTPRLVLGRPLFSHAVHHR